jgi:Domain of unknown function (DUF6968)
MPRNRTGSSMTDFEAVAEREIVCVFPDGRCQSISLRIGRPQRLSCGDWACPVSVDGLYAKLRAMVGVDSWQALMLAIRLVKSLLETEVERGAVLHWPDDERAISPSELVSYGAQPA